MNQQQLEHMLQRHNGVDWRGYFHTLMDRLGDPMPLTVSGQLRMVFPNGLSYGAAPDYTGPEYPAPSDFDELRNLQRRYWHRYRQECETRLAFYKKRLALQGKYSLPFPIQGGDATPDQEQVESFEQRLRECDECLKQLI